MDYRILGPLEVQDGDLEVPLEAPRLRALLALLLLHRNVPVASERLIDELWDGSPPATANKALQNAVSQLRRSLPGDVLRTVGRGYELRVGDSELDADRFESALAAAADDADPESAATTLREALELWRGPPLPELADVVAAQPEIARLEDRRAAAFEARVEADLARGRHAELVGELEAEVARNPLRERLRAQLMLALYRSGRQADALAAYQDARRTLVDELGLEPGPELRARHEAILRQDPALDPPAAAARTWTPAARRAPLALLFGGAALLAVVVAGGVLALTRGDGRQAAGSARCLGTRWSPWTPAQEASPRWFRPAARPRAWPRRGTGSGRSTRTTARSPAPAPRRRPPGPWPCRRVRPASPPARAAYGCPPACPPSA